MIKFGTGEHKLGIPVPSLNRCDILYSMIIPKTVICTERRDPALGTHPGTSQYYKFLLHNILLLSEIIIFKPILKKRIQDHRLILFIEGYDLLLAKRILYPPYICRRIEMILLDHIRSAELHHSVKNSLQQAYLMAQVSLLA